MCLVVFLAVLESDFADSINKEGEGNQGRVNEFRAVGSHDHHCVHLGVLMITKGGSRACICKCTAPDFLSVKKMSHVLYLYLLLF